MCLNLFNIRTICDDLCILVIKLLLSCYIHYYKLHLLIHGLNLTHLYKFNVYALSVSLTHDILYILKLKVSITIFQKHLSSWWRLKIMTVFLRCTWSIISAQASVFVLFWFWQTAVSGQCHFPLLLFFTYFSLVFISPRGHLSPRLNFSVVPFTIN